MAPALVFVAERGSRSLPQAQQNIKAAAEAQQIVAKQRPTLNSFSTLALYTYFTGDFAAAEKAQAEAKKRAGGKAKVEELDKALKETKERAEKFQREVKKAEGAEKAAAKANKGNPESLKNPTNALNGAFGTGGGLTE
jgi:dihydroxyacetone kinase